MAGPVMVLVRAPRRADNEGEDQVHLDEFHQSEEELWLAFRIRGDTLDLLVVKTSRSNT